MSAARADPAAALAALDAIPPAAGGAVMGTGIVSIGLAVAGWVVLSRVLLAITAALWLAIAGVVVHRALRQRSRWLAEARTPAGLTTVAGTAVLGAGLAQLVGAAAAEASLVMTLGLWLALVPAVVRHWVTPTVGVSFVLTVATEAIAVLAAVVALDRQAPSLAVAALVPFLLGAAAYVVVLAEVDLRQLVVGRGDHWILGGALAITTLACADITRALQAGGTLTGLHPLLRDATLGLWAAAVAWLPVLLACELLAPRPGYETRRWSTVFPFGMYAVCSIAAGGAAGEPFLTRLGQAWIWVALAVWAVVFAGMLRRGRRVLARGRPVQGGA